MFGFSIQKVLFTAVAIFVVWQGFKWYRNSQELKAAKREELRRNGGAAKPKAAGEQAKAGAQEMVKCDVCDTYIASDATRACGRDDCPYPG